MLAFPRGCHKRCILRASESENDKDLLRRECQKRGGEKCTYTTWCLACNPVSVSIQCGCGGGGGVLLSEKGIKG